MTQYLQKPFNMLHLCVWIFAVVYCVFCYIKSSQKYFASINDDYNDFTSSSLFSSEKRDKSDSEWETISYLLYNLLPHTIIYLIIASLIKHISLKAYKLWQLSFTVFLIGFYFPSDFLLLFMQPIFFYITRFLSKSKLFVWCCSCLSIMFITFYKKYLFSDYYLSNESHKHLMSVSLSWMNLKCTSFYLENQQSTNFLNFLSYCFYPPMVFSGPFVLYEEFNEVFVPVTINTDKVIRLIKNLLRCTMWYTFGHFCLHYIYVNATSYHPEFVDKLEYVSLCGYGYAMGQFFHLKYVIQYGISTAVASFENIKVPYLPRCIGRTHLYSDMWRYFDPGLYTFLKKHIYIPLVQKFHFKLVASFICFCFVCLWHGPEEYIIIWTVMNYIGILTEYVATNIYKKYLTNISKIVGPIAMQTVTNILASPLLAFSAISNFYFFGGKDIGDIFLRRLFGNFYDCIQLLLILYCCCQVSSNLRTFHAKKME